MGSDLWSDNDNGRPGLSCPAVAETLRAAASLRSPESALQALIGMLIETGPWTAGSICLLTAGKLHTAAYLDARAAEADRLQVEFDEGPALDAVRGDPVQISTDLAGEPRWSRWLPAATALGFCSTVTVRLFTSTTQGTVNLYSISPVQLEAAALGQAQMMAAHVSVVVAGLTTERDLRRAMLTRNVIGQAQGILMQRHGLTAGGAFEYLRHQSQQTNVKLVVLASRIAGAGITTDGADRA